jgi:hypothetical protein
MTVESFRVPSRHPMRAPAVGTEAAGSFLALQYIEFISPPSQAQPFGRFPPARRSVKTTIVLRQDSSDIPARYNPPPRQPRCRRRTSPSPSSTSLPQVSPRKTRRKKKYGSRHRRHGADHAMLTRVHQALSPESRRQVTKSCCRLSMSIANASTARIRFWLCESCPSARVLA